MRRDKAPLVGGRGISPKEAAAEDTCVVPCSLPFFLLAPALRVASEERKEGPSKWPEVLLSSTPMRPSLVLCV